MAWFQSGLCICTDTLIPILRSAGAKCFLKAACVKVGLEAILRKGNLILLINAVHGPHDKLSHTFECRLSVDLAFCEDGDSGL